MQSSQIQVARNLTAALEESEKEGTLEVVPPGMPSGLAVMLPMTLVARGKQEAGGRCRASQPTPWSQRHEQL